MGHVIVSDLSRYGSSRSRQFALAVLYTGMLMIVLDLTITNVALPSIQRDLGFSQAKPLEDWRQPMTSAQLSVNGMEYSVPVVEGVTLQFALRDDLGLTGTKFGCGMAQCGCCTVLLDGAPVRSCITPVSAAVGKAVTTIEGLAKDGARHPLQQAWIDAGVPQCGYCQSGQLMEAAALLGRNARPSDAEIREAMDGHLCRCGTYNRIVQAIQLAAARMEGGPT